ncbi:hypothetical protein OTBS_0563 [Orientia tsutsugamushi str. Boryong]|uniref:Uncharacterized protein n=1 Tax=Orientia tsutsugamushi (strain Boryong) TaxID=357244 RepID=A5CCZ5_ORITB|nr:hypothetical protein OTBS_0563 [Orientia tsutsugamushi str. Boryong]
MVKYCYVNCLGCKIIKALPQHTVKRFILKIIFKRDINVAKSCHVSILDFLLLYDIYYLK